MFYYLLCSVAGIAAGWLMHFFMLMVSHRQPTRADMVRAIGSYGTGTVGPSAQRIGFLVHTLGGAILGAGYGTLFAWIGINDRGVVVFAGTVLGFAHGLVVCYLLLYWVSLHHPLKEYRKASIPVGLIHLCGHVFFGLVLSIMILVGSRLAVNAEDRGTVEGESSFQADPGSDR